jgi:hypothetical protein
MFQYVFLLRICIFLFECFYYSWNVNVLNVRTCMSEAFVSGSSLYFLAQSGTQ